MYMNVLLVLGILLTDQGLRHGVGVLSQGLNQNCAKEKVKDIQDCLYISKPVIGLTENDVQNQALGLTPPVCVSNELTRICARKHLTPCGEETVRQFFQGQPSLPECKNFTADTKMKADCSSAWGVRKRYLTCQINTGIFLPRPAIDSSDQISEFMLNIITLVNSTQMCKKLPQASDLINCSLSVQRECSSDSLKSTVPDIQYTQEGLQQLCKNIDGFDVDCVSNADSSACGNRKKRAASQQSDQKSICQAAGDHNKCLVDSVKSCGKVTSSRYGDILSAQLPQMCQKARPKPTVTDNSGYKPTVSLFILIISVILLH